ncbi:MAG: CPBP family intramembrane metalloprotease, partial [Acholeplasmataceae bacterium]|nr:CPBP family intramembrane metalloprotease [Acholeplasmataceae bacterium]
NIIEFEDLFKEEIKKRKEIHDPLLHKNFGSAIMVYLLIMFVVASFFYMLMLKVDTFVKIFSEDELILENVTFDGQGIAFIDIDTYELYEETYERYLLFLDSNMGYFVVVNQSNVHAKNIFYLIETVDETETEVFNNQAVLDIISGEILIWDTDIEIHIFIGKNQSLPFVVDADYFEVEGPISDMSSFGTSLLNFLTYLLLLPALVFFLRRNLVFDFVEFKQKKPQWFSIIVIGYLYLLAGNFISSVLSDLLSMAFKINVGESVNQITIVRALHSEGLVLMLASAIFMGPIVEELIFRKSIFGLIKNDKMALAVSTISFGVIHLIGEASILHALVSGISYFVMGLVFGFIYIKNNKNIWPVIIVHVLANLISILLILFLI